MKKTYIRPTTEVVKVNLTHIIAASELGLNDSLSDVDQGLVDKSDRVKGRMTLWEDVW